MDRNKETDNKKANTGIKPDKGTVQNTDPQQNMEGPMSSPTKQTGKVFDSNESREHAEERRSNRL